VASASSSVLLNTRREEPRKRRRGEVIKEIRNHTLSFRNWDLWKRTRHNPCAFFDRNDLIRGEIGKPIDLSARPCDLQRIDLRMLSQSKMNTRIAGRHIAHPTFGLFDLNGSVRR